MPELKTRQNTKSISYTINKRFTDLKTISLLISFFVPFIILMVCYIIRDVAPFGDNSLCSMDGFSQYYPMLENMARALKKGELFYSFSGSLGYNLWAQTAYYTNSPLWLLVYILPERFHMSAIDITIALRISLAAMTFCIRLNSRSKVTSVKLLPYIALSCAYSMSAYTVAYINQFMWADAIVLLPLVIMGIEQLFEKKKPFLYIISLFLTIWSCFYIGYMVCLFAVIYMLYLLFSEKYPLKERILKTLRFAGTSLIAGGLSASSIIPVFFAISQTKASSLGIEKIEFYNNLVELMKNFLPFSKISLEYGAPNVYCGIVTLVLCAALLFAKKIPLRKRIAAFSLAMFMLVSFELNVLTYVWHGFHFPNQLPGRHSFLLIFFLVAVAAEFFNIIEYKTPTEYSPAVNFLSSNSTMAVFLATLLLLEVCSSAANQICDQTWVSKISSVQRDSDTAQSIAAMNPGENEFYRAEFTSSKKNNPGLQYGYNGISYYSSTMSAAAYDFFERLGMSRYAQNVSTHYEHSEISDALFAVKYIVNDDGKTVTENKNLLPLVFKADKGILDFDINNHRGIILQQEMWYAVCGKDKISVSDGVKLLNKCGMKITSFSSSHIEGTISCDASGVLFTSIPDDGGWQIYIDGEKVPIKRICSYFCGAEILKGEHSITLKYTPPGFVVGISVSLSSLLAVVILLIIFRRKKNVHF